ncbi:MAG: hypothetical protein ACOZBH_04795 [Patescibacteria group bacterium]
MSIRIPLNALILTLINLGSVLLSLEIVNVSSIRNNVAWVAALLAVLFSMIGYWVFRFIARSFRERFVIFQGIAFAYLYIFSLIWMAVIYIAGYYMIRGSWPEFGNLVMLWAFQLPTNYLALYIVYEIHHKQVK